MSEIRDRDEFVLTVNRLMICAMEDIDCGRDEAGPTTLDLVQRIEEHDAALRAENERLRDALRLHAALLAEQGAGGADPDPAGTARRERWLRDSAAEAALADDPDEDGPTPLAPPPAPSDAAVREAAELRRALEREADCKCRALYCRHTSAAIDAAWTLLAALAARGERGK